MVEAFPEDTAPRFLLRDRDAIYGEVFKDRVQSLGIEEILTAPQSPWQNAYCERFLGSLRRECLAHVIILSERHLKRIVKSYLEYYHPYLAHLSLGKDGPQPRPVEPPSLGEVVSIPRVGGIPSSRGLSQPLPFSWISFRGCRQRCLV